MKSKLGPSIDELGIGSIVKDNERGVGVVLNFEKQAENCFLKIGFSIPVGNEPLTLIKHAHFIDAVWKFPDLEHFPQAKLTWRFVEHESELSLGTFVALTKSSRIGIICLCFKDFDQKLSLTVEWTDNAIQHFVDPYFKSCCKIGELPNLEDVSKESKTPLSNADWSTMLEKQLSEIHNCTVANVKAKLDPLFRAAILKNVADKILAFKSTNTILQLNAIELERTEIEVCKEAFHEMAMSYRFIHSLEGYQQELISQKNTDTFMFDIVVRLNVQFSYYTPFS